MKEQIPTANRYLRSERLKVTIRFTQAFQRLFLWCGVAASLLYAAMNIVAAGQYPGYSSVSQTVSELSAIGAPSRSLWVVLGSIYSVLMFFFAQGVVTAGRRQRPLLVTGWLLSIYTALGFFWPPMHQRGHNATLSDTFHLVFAAVTVVLMLTAVWFGSLGFGRGFRIYSRITLVALILFGFLTSLDAPNVAANLPTPLIGVWERIDIGLFLVWIVTLALAILRRSAEDEEAER